MADPRRRHASLTPERIADAAEAAISSLDNPGFCLACGQDADGCEPDAVDYRCEACGERAVWGASELLISIVA